LTGLVKAIDKFAAEHKDDGARAYVVFALPQDENEPKVKELASKEELKLPLCFFDGGPDGENADKLKLNDEVPLTIVLAAKNDVKKNYVFTDLKEELTEEHINAILDDWKGIL